MLETATHQVVEEVPAWQRVHLRLKAIAKARADLDANEAEALRDAERLRLWARLGFATLLEYLEHELGYTPRIATERVRVARALATLPLTSGALREGSLSYSAVRELTRVATAATEQQWLDAVRGKNLRQVESMTSGRAPGALPSDPVDPALQRSVVRFELRVETQLLIRQARQLLSAERGSAVDDDDLLLAMARSVLDGPSGARRSSAHQIAITVCDRCKRGWQDGAGVSAELPTAALETAICDAEEIGRLDAPRGTPLVATVAPATRRLVLRRDHGKCVVPTCRSARNLDLHHVVARKDGGTHEPSNLVTLCAGHHRALHEGALTISGRAPDQLSIVRGEESALDVATRFVEIRKALVDLGFSGTEAKRAIEEAITHVGNSPRTLAEWVHESLRCCPRPGSAVPPDG